MTKPDFAAMDKQQLKAYVLEHREDDEAFYALADRIQAQPGIEITSMEQLRQLIEEKRSARQQTDE
jgi:hypothetical protein